MVNEGDPNTRKKIIFKPPGIVVDGNHYTYTCMYVGRSLFNSVGKFACKTSEAFAISLPPPPQDWTYNVHPHSPRLPEGFQISPRHILNYFKHELKVR